MRCQSFAAILNVVLTNDFRILSNYTEYKPGNTTGQYRPDNTTGLVQDIGLDRTKWTVAASTVKQCLSLKTREYCQLQFSMQFMIIVIVCNLFKCIAMLCTLFFERDTPLTTVGDALASWLDEPDDSTKGSCLITKDKPHTENIGVDAVNTSSITYYAPFTRRWHHATSTRRWGVTITLWTAALFVTTGFMGRAIATAGATGRTITSFGFGSVNSRTTIDIGTTFSTGKQLLGAVLLVNLPQALLSFLYMMSNGLITSMCAAHEYSKYSVARRSLRVTDPVGRQRSTYWLQLPFAYSIPLIITSGLLHWVVSQSIFLVKISYWMDRVESLHQAKSAVGYSCWPIICTISIGFTIVFTITAMGFRRLPGMIPIAGSCSLAIAAAAHRPEDDVEAASCLVKWGEVPQVSDGAVGHCCFTSKEVTDVRPGKKYA